MSAPFVPTTRMIHADTASRESATPAFRTIADAPAPSKSEAIPTRATAAPGPPPPARAVKPTGVMGRDPLAGGPPQQRSGLTAEIVDRLAIGCATELVNARGSGGPLPGPDPPAGQGPRGVERMREEQVRYCAKYVVPVIGDVRCRELARSDFQRILDQARTASVARQVRRTLTAVVNAGLSDGYLLPRQDVLRGVRRLPRDGTEATVEPSTRSITGDEIPTVVAVHRLTADCGARSRVWWRELEALLVAYSGLRWGEHTALTASQLGADRGSPSTARSSSSDSG